MVAIAKINLCGIDCALDSGIYFLLFSPEFLDLISMSQAFGLVLCLVSGALSVDFDQLPLQVHANLGLFVELGLVRFHVHLQGMYGLLQSRSALKHFRNVNLNNLYTSLRLNT